MTADLDKPVELLERTVLRKKLATIRAEGMVPAVVHNHGESSIHVMGPEVQLKEVYKEAGKHHPLQLQVGSKQYLALIKDVHMNPIKKQMQHVVFQAIKQDEKVEAEIPIRIEGEIPAEKVGLMILHQLDEVEVEALPKNLPDELVVDGSVLAELHDKITVADIKIPDGVTVLVEPDHPIATVVETRAQVAEEAAEEEAAEEGEEPQEGQEEETPEAGGEPSEDE